MRRTAEFGQWFPAAFYGFPMGPFLQEDGLGPYGFPIESWPIWEGIFGSLWNLTLWWTLCGFVLIGPRKSGISVCRGVVIWHEPVALRLSAHACQLFLGSILDPSCCFSHVTFSASVTLARMAFAPQYYVELQGLSLVAATAFVQ